MEEGREGEQQQAGGSQEKGQLERSEKEELKDLSGEPLRRTRTLERQVDISYLTPSVANWPKIRLHNLKGVLNSGAAGQVCGRILADLYRKARTSAGKFVFYSYS
jgi:hypothetical protein